ncbi:unnamed protein product [Blepharisma stoltei]|uniref:Dpy-30-like protein n=1 Tax=Blepharisma stoltei TaxID=1481888 RepID=A0AAU9JXI2_9CILI|nr:unnamed protein product [Blepharisma stoltei]
MDSEVSSMKSKSMRMIDPECGYDNPEEGLKAEETAQRINNKLNPKIMPTRTYLNSTVSEIVLKALSELDQCRPSNPVEFFAYYLLKHNQ